ncbi:MAG: SIS domain-containing protein [Bacteroidales bacterium]
MLEKIRNTIAEEINAVKNIPVSDSYEKVVNVLYDRVHKSGGKIVASGVGKAGQIALNMATTFSSTGTPAIFMHPTEAQHGDLGVLQKNDVLLTVSNSGKTREILELIPLAKRLIKDIPIIAITGKEGSDLDKLADFTLLTGNPKEVCKLGLTPSTSMTVMNIIGDILVVLMCDRTGFSHEEYSKRHHGGYLGSKARREGENANK